jgi:hypothetical protein
MQGSAPPPMVQVGGGYFCRWLTAMEKIPHLTDCDQDYGLAPVKMYEDQIADLDHHVTDEMLLGRDKLIEYAAGLAADVWAMGHTLCNGASTEPDVVALLPDTTAEQCRRYRLAVRQLAATLDYLAVISDRFESVLPDRADTRLPAAMLGGIHGGAKCYAKAIAEEAEHKYIPLIERRLKAASVPGHWQ